MEKDQLIALLKEKGLDVAENTATQVVKDLFDIVEAVVKLTDNKYDDMLIPMLGIVRPKIEELLDKIDGKIG